MPGSVPFRLSLTGDAADYHQFQAYDGYNALAGFAWTLSLVTNYVETGVIRHRGDFPGRRAVRAKAISEGSLNADFIVWITDNAQMLGLGAGLGAAPFLYSVVRRVIARNLGEDVADVDPEIAELNDKRGGDLEALVALTEPAIRQTHSVIGKGADDVTIVGGFNVLAELDHSTKAYVTENFEDDEFKEAIVTVAAFNANSGYGSVFDPSLGRTVPISMSRENLRRLRRVFSWGLDQYANRTGETIRIGFTRIMALDGTPKRYLIQAASR